MSEQTDEELFGRMRAVLVARCDQSEYNDTANRGVMIWHRDTGWGAGVLATSGARLWRLMRNQSVTIRLRQRLCVRWLNK